MDDDGLKGGYSADSEEKTMNGWNGIEKESSCNTIVLAICKMLELTTCTDRIRALNTTSRIRIYKSVY